MMFGYSLAEGNSSTPLWIGGLLIVLGAVTLGVSIGNQEKPKNNHKPNQDTE